MIPIQRIMLAVVSGIAGLAALYLIRSPGSLPHEKALQLGAVSLLIAASKAASAASPSSSSAAGPCSSASAAGGGNSGSPGNGGNVIQGALSLLGPELAALPAARERAAEILARAPEEELELYHKATRKSAVDDQHRMFMLNICSPALKRTCVTGG